MKKIIVVLVLLAVVFIVWNRNRLYLRDPLGNVLRDGVKQRGAQVFINYSNELLVENDNAPMYVLLIQHGPRAGVPTTLRCVHYVVCFTDADHATLLTDQGMRVDSMTSRAVAFREGKGSPTTVTIR